MSINPFSLTSKAFADAMFSLHGRGWQQAFALYQSLYRLGEFSSNLPPFQNAPKLYEEMVQTASFPLYKLKLCVRDECVARYLLETEDKYPIEAVVIAMKTRKTVCVSSQIGCRMGCLFCATGKMGFHRNLRAHEIIQQVFAARFILGENVQNVVFMGMGEPFDNFDEVMNAVDILSDEAGMGIGLRRITLSTSGDTRGILHLAAKGQKIPNLAVSLHSADEEIRKNLVPARRKESLSTLHNAMKTYCENTGRQILISCVLLKNINDDLRAAEKLVDYLQGLSVKVNIIPYNQSGVGEYMSPDPSVVEAFLQYLRGRHIPALLRHERGGKNQAACGQLGSRYQNDFYA